MPAGPSHHTRAYIDARGWVRRLIHTNWRPYPNVDEWMTGTTTLRPSSPYVRSVAKQTGGHGITHRLRDLAVGWPIPGRAPPGVPAVLYYVRYSCGSHTFYPQSVPRGTFIHLPLEQICGRCFPCHWHDPHNQSIERNPDEDS